MYFQRNFITSLENFQVFKGTVLIVHFLLPVSCTLVPDIRSFGTVLSPVEFSAQIH